MRIPLILHFFSGESSRVETVFPFKTPLDVLSMNESLLLTTGSEELLHLIAFQHPKNVVNIGRFFVNWERLRIPGRKAERIKYLFFE